MTLAPLVDGFSELASVVVVAVAAAAALTTCDSAVLVEVPLALLPP